MCGGSRVNDEAFGVADVGEVGEELQKVNEFFARFETALNAKANDASY